MENLVYKRIINKYWLLSLIIAISLITPSLCISQDFDYARQSVDTLASDEMKGRGYVQTGDKKAADYINDQFKEIGLTSFNRSYFQKFNISVNTFPNEMGLTLNNHELVPGRNFLINPGSPSIKGKYKTVQITTEDILNQNMLLGKLKRAKGRFLVIPPFSRNEYSKEQLIMIDEVLNFLRYHQDNPASGMIELTFDKLTWSTSTLQNSKPTFIVKVEDTDIKIDQLEVNVKAKFIDQYRTQNVIGYTEGKRSDSLVVFVAHYDHLGMMGEDTIFPGANDNASGVAMLLNLAKYYQNNRPEFRTVFIAFAGEELGLLGANHFVENPLFPLNKIKFLINFDIAGTGDDGIQVVNGSVYQEQFSMLKSINEEQNLLKQVKIRGAACNSDHCMFDRAGVPSFFIYTLGGIQAYHDIDDKAETLPLSEFEDYFKLITEFVDLL